MRIEIDGEIFPYATHFIQSKDDPTYRITDEGKLEATEVTFLPDETERGLETSVILHKTKDGIPWQEGARIFNALGPDGKLHKVPALAAVISCEDIEKVGLSVDPKPDDERGLPHHANIVSWQVNKLSCEAACLAIASEIRVNPNREQAFQQRIRTKLAERGIKLEENENEGTDCRDSEGDSTGV